MDSMPPPAKWVGYFIDGDVGEPTLGACLYCHGHVETTRAKAEALLPHQRRTDDPATLTCRCKVVERPVDPRDPFKPLTPL